MKDIYDQAAESYDNDCKEADREQKYIMKETMGADFDTFFYQNKEGEDVRELAAKAETMRDAIREEEIAQNHYEDNKF